jgi:hypothetical protein
MASEIITENTNMRELPHPFYKSRTINIAMAKFVKAFTIWLFPKKS